MNRLAICLLFSYLGLCSQARGGTIAGGEIERLGDGGVATSAPSTEAIVDGCPETTIETRREMLEDRRLRIHCTPIAELSITDIATLDPAAIERLSLKDRVALERLSTGLPVFARVDQAVYVTPEWAAYARQQQRQLIAKRVFLMRQLTTLQDRRIEFTDAIIANDELARDLIADDMVNTLTVIGAAAQAIAAEGGLPPSDAERISLLVTTARAEINVRAVARARTVPSDRFIDASMGIKNLLVAYPALPISAKERAAIVRGTDALFKLAKIGQRWSDGQPFDLKGLAAAADDVVNALTDIPMLATGKAARSTVQAAMSEYTLERMKQDQAELQRAYRNHIVAEEFLNQRIAQADLWLSVYRKSLEGQ